MKHNWDNWTELHKDYKQAVELLDRAREYVTELAMDYDDCPANELLNDIDPFLEKHGE
jgi:hypothetical protein